MCVWARTVQTAPVFESAFVWGLVCRGYEQQNSEPGRTIRSQGGERKDEFCSPQYLKRKLHLNKKKKNNTVIK